MILRRTVCWLAHSHTDHSAWWSAITWMQIKFSILNLSKCIYLNILFCSNHIMWCRRNVERTWDKTPQQDLQFYRNELDVQSLEGVICNHTLSRYYRLCHRSIEKASYMAGQESTDLFWDRGDAHSRSSPSLVWVDAAYPWCHQLIASGRPRRSVWLS